MPSRLFLGSASAHRDRLATAEENHDEENGQERCVENRPRESHDDQPAGMSRAALWSEKSAVSCHTMSIVREAAGRSRARNPAPGGLRLRSPESAPVTLMHLR